MPTTVDDVTKIITDLPPGEDVSWAVDDANAMFTALFVGTTLSQPQQDIICKYLAAHFLSLKLERSGLTQDVMGPSSQSYNVNKNTTGLASSRYGNMAITLDPTGTLADLDATSMGTANFSVGIPWYSRSWRYCI